MYNSLEIIRVICRGISQFKEIMAVSLSCVVHHVVHHEVCNVHKLEAAVLHNVPDSALHQFAPVGQSADTPVNRVGNLFILPQPSDITFIMSSSVPGRLA